MDGSGGPSPWKLLQMYLQHSGYDADPPTYIDQATRQVKESNGSPKCPQLYVSMASIASMDEEMVVKFNDSKGDVMNGYLHRHVVRDFSSLLHKGTVLWLKDVSVFHPVGEEENVHLNVTLYNVAGVFNSSMSYNSSEMLEVPHFHAFQLDGQMIGMIHEKYYHDPQPRRSPNHQDLMETAAGASVSVTLTQKDLIRVQTGFEAVNRKRLIDKYPPADPNWQWGALIHHSKATTISESKQIDNPSVASSSLLSSSNNNDSQSLDNNDQSFNPTSEPSVEEEEEICWSSTPIPTTIPVVPRPKQAKANHPPSTYKTTLDHARTVSVSKVSSNDTSRTAEAAFDITKIKNLESFDTLCDDLDDDMF